ncbi:hypothetical protein [Methanoculleus chikugoensis]|uniref:hypothetical protein n=1 Tax=Methanoculleus chikugoensis TaxID=118126 RepID=UPI000A3FC183|nr:hypothetical protein [Methanoculleus chikugoensis]
MNTTYDIQNAIGSTKNPIYVSSLDSVPGIGPEERARLAEVTDHFAFRANDYYLSLIDWDDPPADPIRRLIVPTVEELEPWGHLDPSSEHRYTQAPGLQHKYRETALLLVSDICGGLCRYCFRKRLFIEEAREVNKEISTGGLAYIRDHPEITNVLLTGGAILSSSRPAGCSISSGRSARSITSGSSGSARRCLHTIPSGSSTIRRCWT